MRGIAGASGGVGGATGRAWDPSEGVDLRRRQRRDQVEELLERARVLPEGERALVEAVYRDGRSALEVSRLANASARTMRRRIRRAVQRAGCPRVAFVASASARWPATRRRVAQATVIEGMSIRRAAQTLGLSYHTVRRHREAVEAMFLAARDLAGELRGRCA